MGTTGQYPKVRNAGTIAAIVGDPTPRFGDFVQALWAVLARMQNQASLAWCQGVNVTGNCNEACKKVLEAGSEWLWLIGDDHVFQPDILHRLLAHEVDVLVPHCLIRTPPYPPVLYGGSDGDVHSVSAIPKEGLFEVHAAGQAGMLIRRNVLEKIGEPWFETFGKQNEDLMFSRKIREAGFKIHCDPEILLGHIGLVAVWPVSTPLGWGVDLDLGGEDGKHRVVCGRVGNSITPVG